MEMAPSLHDAPSQPSPPTTRQNNLRNPLPLSPTQEQEVRRLYHERARRRCATVIKDFADCARGRTISVAWHCKDQHLAMNSCMMQYATKVEEDAAREEWFEGIMARRRKKEEELVKVEERRREVIELTRRQEEKERVEMERKKREVEEAQRRKDAEKKGSGWWSR
jgi:COX assembly protein 1